jgi:DNA gyrase inhibitor GyrI
MNQTNIKLTKIKPMRVASIYSFGVNPEEEVWEKLSSWAEPRGLLKDIRKNPIFGFTNPSLANEKAQYGYELWIKVDSSIEPEGEIRIVEFNGGPYAVARCHVMGNPAVSIPAAWMNLMAWCKVNNHPLGYHQMLEKFINPDSDLNSLILDLYCPVLN